MVGVQPCDSTLSDTTQTSTACFSTSYPRAAGWRDRGGHSRLSVALHQRSHSAPANLSLASVHSDPAEVRGGRQLPAKHFQQSRAVHRQLRRCVLVYWNCMHSADQMRTDKVRSFRSLVIVTFARLSLNQIVVAENVNALKSQVGLSSAHMHEGEQLQNTSFNTYSYVKIRRTLLHSWLITPSKSLKWADTWRLVASRRASKTSRRPWECSPFTVRFDCIAISAIIWTYLQSRDFQPLRTAKVYSSSPPPATTTTTRRASTSTRRRSTTSTRRPTSGCSGAPSTARTSRARAATRK